jgi:SAM-dependent methyltransferase
MKKNIIKDANHGYLRVDPIPSVAEVEKYYKEDFYAESNNFFNDSSLEVQLSDQEFFNSRWKRYYEILENYFENLEDKNIYDIGFGYAQTLLYFKSKGLKCSGIEPSKEGVDFALENGINGKVGGIEDENSYKSESKQDVVMMINVLEHLRTPFETLCNIKDNLISDNGILIIDVPNEFNDFQLAANAENNLNDWWICPPKHINYFSPSSLKILLKNSGFEIIKQEASFPIEMFLLFGDMYVGDATLGSECHKKRVNFEKVMIKNGFKNKLNAFYESLAELELGRQITIYAKPIKN